MIILRTLPKKWQYVASAIIIYLIWPINEVIYQFENLRRGLYPVNSDSISIPVFKYITFWILFIPIYVIFIRIGYKKYKSGVYFFSSLVLKPLPILISLLSLVFIALMFDEIYWAILKRHYFSIINAILQIWLCLYIRALLCRKEEVYEKTE